MLIMYRLRLKQAIFLSAHDGLGAALYVQLAKDVVDMGLDRAHGDDQPLCNLPIGETRRHQLEYFQFAVAEGLD